MKLLILALSMMTALQASAKNASSVLGDNFESGSYTRQDGSHAQFCDPTVRARVSGNSLRVGNRYFVWKNIPRKKDADSSGPCATYTEQIVKNAGAGSVLVQNLSEECQAGNEVADPQRHTVTVQGATIELVTETLMKSGKDYVVDTRLEPLRCLWKKK